MWSAMPVYLFILHEQDVVLTKFEHELPDDATALEVAQAASQYAEVDLWAGERIVAQLERSGAGCNTLSPRCEAAS